MCRWRRAGTYQRVESLERLLGLVLLDKRHRDYNGDGLGWGHSGQAGQEKLGNSKRRAEGGGRKVEGTDQRDAKRVVVLPHKEADESGAQQQNNQRLFKLPGGG